MFIVVFFFFFIVVREAKAGPGLQLGLLLLPYIRFTSQEARAGLLHGLLLLLFSCSWE